MYFSARSVGRKAAILVEQAMFKGLVLSLLCNVQHNAVFMCEKVRADFI